VTFVLGAAAVDGFGNEEANRLIGNNARNLMRGEKGHGVLVGAGGADTLVGGSDDDTVAGGAGADTLLFEVPGKGVDRVNDFAVGTDTVAVLADEFGGGLIAALPLTPAHNVSHGSNLATGPGAQFVFNTTSKLLSWDTDGAGSEHAVPFARLIGVASLAAADFVAVA
jgi:Ca2+-binding RTX toxin-like protein